MSDESVTHWIMQLKEGDEKAAELIWRRYFDQLVRHASRRLAGAPRRAADEEDVVLSAFDSFYRNAAAGRFPRLSDREGLWKLLFAIVERKSLDHLKFERRQKRGSGKVRGDSVFSTPNGLESQRPRDGFVSLEPTPDFAVEVAEQVRYLLDRLGDDSLRDVALMKMQGYTNEEISSHLKCSQRSVTRKLKVIRTVWSEALE